VPLSAWDSVAQPATPSAPAAPPADGTNATNDATDSGDKISMADILKAIRPDKEAA
jgi:hypothetical protein